MVNIIHDEYTNLKISPSLRYFYRNRNSEKVKIWRKRDNERKREKYKNDISWREKKIKERQEAYFKDVKTEREKSKLRWKKRRLEVLIFVGGKNGIKCKKCGFDDIRAIQVDHINGGGRAEVRRFKDNKKYLEHIKENTKNYQLLCANCNWIKKHENNEVKYVAKKLKTED